MPFHSDSYPEYLRKFADFCDQSDGPKGLWGIVSKIGEYVPLSWDQWIKAKHEEFLDNRHMRDIYLDELWAAEAENHLGKQQETKNRKMSCWIRL